MSELAGKKPILCLDFDGVCHQYTTKWQAADIIPDEYVPGLFEFLEEAKKDFDIQIFSTRSHQEGGQAAMALWFVDQRKLWRSRGNGPVEDTPLHLSFPDTKPPAFVGIDDRVLTFEGSWPTIDTLRNFKPWNKRNV